MKIEELIDRTPPLQMEAEGEAASEGESAKGNSSGKIDDESASTEDDETSEDEEISEEERAKWAHIDREVFKEQVLSEEEEMDEYRRGWESRWADQFGSFEQETTLSSMLTTHDRTIVNAWAETALQVYSIKVDKAKLTWPLHVYGMVAARDPVDHNRNLLFNRKRDNCQIITKNDPYLLLTGPSRAIVFLDPVVFEIILKVKGESEDKETMIHQTYWYRGTIGSRGTSCSNKLCKINLNFMELDETVQATITSVQIIRGSWPRDFAGQVFCQDGSSPKEVMLLDFPHGENPPVDEAGNLDLSRRVVSVDVHSDMKVTVRAYSIAGGKKIPVGSGVVSFTPGQCGVTERECDLDGQCQLKIEVAWSLLVVTKTLFRS